MTNTANKSFHRIAEKAGFPENSAFAERFDHIVHGVGTDPTNAWNTKRETEREGIRRIYEDFFSNVADMRLSIRTGPSIRKIGHIFQGRYKSILVEKESHLLEA